MRTGELVWSNDGTKCSEGFWDPPSPNQEPLNEIVTSHDSLIFLHFGRNQMMSLWWWSLTGVVREMVSTWLIRERQPVHFFVRTRDVRTYSWLCQDMICWHIETQARIYRCWFICTCTCYMYDKCVYTHTWLNICWTYYEYINVHVHISYLIYPYRTEHVFMSSKTLGAPFAQFFPILRSKNWPNEYPEISVGAHWPWVRQVVWIWWWSSCWSCILAGEAPGNQGCWFCLWLSPKQQVSLDFTAYLSVVWGLVEGDVFDIPIL